MRYVLALVAAIDCVVFGLVGLVAQITSNDAADTNLTAHAIYHSTEGFFLASLIGFVIFIATMFF